MYVKGTAYLSQSTLGGAFVCERGGLKTQVKYTICVCVYMLKMCNLILYLQLGTYNHSRLAKYVYQHPQLHNTIYLILRSAIIRRI